MARRCARVSRCCAQAVDDFGDSLMIVDWELLTSAFTIVNVLVVSSFDLNTESCRNSQRKSLKSQGLCEVGDNATDVSSGGKRH